MSFSIHARSDAEPVDSRLLQLFVSETMTAQYFYVALLTVLAYHSIITMDKEVKYFWPTPLNSVSLLFFANRYIGFLGAICFIVLVSTKASRCQMSTWITGVSNLITIVLIDYILLIRVLALYHQNKVLGICLKALLALEAATDLGIVVYIYLFDEVAVGGLAEGVTICGVNRDPPVALGIVSWAIPMVYGLVLLILALYKAAECWGLSNGFKGFHLVAVLIQDQVIYYGFVIFCCVLNIVDIRIFSLNQVVADLLSVAGSPTLLCVLGGQLLINLKEAGERGVNGGTNYGSDSISDIQFA